ncbi:phage tail protein [Companilactobacillus allii]|uniref:Prophage tail endopeptidase domain-containing protein n=1 Tax=Companilactobacillus allii TaxID=1847728 RepID=A0A1P8Q4R7_9LACO|nr:prophage endopeptidase tail family protein [Companilactobacillus allii]APX72856.1 hypothetical protein BTM29_09975 [Companilactobacillus allii]USQ67645.1 phage tail protein [Companilactobacillus allii]
MLTIYDLRNKAAPLINYGEIKLNEKVNAVAQLDTTVYDFDENDVGFQMIQERSILELSDNGQQYRILNRSEDSLGIVKEKNITAYHVLHDLNDRVIHKPATSKVSNTEETSTGNAIGTINTMEDGGAPIYSAPVAGKILSTRLSNGSDWKIDKQVVVNSTKWYRVATNEWINEKYISFDKDGDVKPENPTITKVLGRGTIKVTASDDSNTINNGEATPTGNAIGTINTMEDGGAPTYSAPGGSNIVSHLSNGTMWKINLVKSIDNVNWYSVGTNQWVSDKYLTFDKDSDVKPEEHEVTVVLGKGTIKLPEKSSKDDDDKKSSELYDAPFSPQHKLGRQLPNKTTWKITAEVSSGAQGKSWYRVGVNQWVTQEVFDFSSASDVKPQKIDDSAKSVQVFDSPVSPQKMTGQELENGTQWRINGSVSDGAGGKSWYRVSTNGWVEQTNFDFSDKYDVQPEEIKDDSSDEKDDSVQWSIGQFMSYITSGTKFTFNIYDDFEMYNFDQEPDGNALDLFLNDGVSDYGYEFTVDNYHINLFKKIGSDNSFAFVDSGNVSKISTTNDDTSIKTHILGEFSQKIDSSDKNSSDSMNGDDSEQVITAEYTSPHVNLYGIIDDEYFTDDSASSKDELLQHMKDKLQDYPLTQITLEYHEFKKNNLLQSVNDVGIGNSGFIKDRYDIDISARIIEITKYLHSPTNKEPEITFGNIIGDFADTLSQLNSNARNSAYKIITN